MPELTLEAVQSAVDAILAVLDEPTTDLHATALAAFNAGEHQRVKRLAATHLADHYCRSLGYLGSALKLTPNTDTILAEAARAAADFARENALAKLSQAISEALDREPALTGIE